MYSSILEAVKLHSEQIPNQPALIDDTTQYSYKMLYQKIRQTAHTFTKINIQKGSYVIVECMQNVPYMVLNFACSMTGSVFVPIEMNATPARVRDIFTETKADCIIGHTDYSDVGKFYNIDALFADMDKTLFSEYLPDADDTAEILYSTGTTGKPKGIMLSHRANVAVAENIISGVEMPNLTVELIPMPLSHSHGLRTCYANLLNGSTSVIIDGIMNIAGFFNMIKAYGVNALDLSPTLAKLLIKAAKQGLKECSRQLDYIELGTAVLDDDVKDHLKELFPDTRLYNFYGSTEAGRSCTYNFNREDFSKCIGYPTRHAKFIITDTNRNIIKSSAQHPGFIAVSGEMLMKGYYNGLELTREAVADGILYTSDFGYIDDAGRVYVFGRADDIINYKGIKISPEEIETVAAGYPGIIDCACVPVEDRLCGQAPKLFIQTGHEAFDKKAYLSFLKENLEASRIPVAIEIIEKIPRTANGKLQRKKLKTQTI